AGPIGGDGVADPAGTWSLSWPAIFLAILSSALVVAGPYWSGGCSPVVRFDRPAEAGLTSHLFTRQKCRRLHPARAERYGSALFDLSEFEIHRHRAPEDRNFDLEAGPLLVHFLDEAVKRGERPVRHAHLLADLEGDRRLRPLDPLLHLMEDTLSLLVGDVHRLGRMLILAEKPGDPRRVLDQRNHSIVEIGLHQHIAREELALGVNLLAPPDLDDLFRRDHDLFDAVTKALLPGLVLYILRNLLFEVRIGVNDIPPRSHAASPSW